ncbi:MAG TPA: sulfotransferase, partial [Thermomonospora sp.]|nr:sulfotransferase [Thermomonospora sp.]
MLHVIGAGFPRTGTSSMKAALERLGFGPCHHMFEVITRPDQVARWLDVLRDGPVDWDAVLAGYRSAVDWPAGFFWRELAAAHQDAKVILTVRDPRRWYVSMRDTIFQATVTPIPEGAHPYLKTTRALRESLLDGIWRRTFGVGTDTIPGE